jgi:hypothetical protein
MNDQPTAEVLLRAVERFLEQEVVPALQGPARFHARVAANVVAMVAREVETDEAHLTAEWEGLGHILGDPAPRPPGRAALREGVRLRNAALVERIRAGDADAGPFRAEVLGHLRRTVEQKLAVSRPPRQRRSRP